MPWKKHLLALADALEETPPGPVPDLLVDLLTPGHRPAGGAIRPIYPADESILTC